MPYVSPCECLSLCVNWWHLSKTKPGQFAWQWSGNCQKQFFPLDFLSIEDILEADTHTGWDRSIVGSCFKHSVFITIQSARVFSLCQLVISPGWRFRERESPGKSFAGWKLLFLTRRNNWPPWQVVAGRISCFGTGCGLGEGGPGAMARRDRIGQREVGSRRGQLREREEWAKRKECGCCGRPRVQVCHCHAKWVSGSCKSESTAGQDQLE